MAKFGHTFPPVWKSLENVQRRAVQIIVGKLTLSLSLSAVRRSLSTVWLAYASRTTF